MQMAMGFLRLMIVIHCRRHDTQAHPSCAMDATMTAICKWTKPCQKAASTGRATPQNGAYASEVPGCAPTVNGGVV
jgi:hypothetical protein